MLEPVFNKVAGLHFACEGYLLTAASDFLESSFLHKTPITNNSWHFAFNVNI